jgi:hypothetical protein
MLAPCRGVLLGARVLPGRPSGWELLYSESGKKDAVSGTLHHTRIAADGADKLQPCKIVTPTGTVGAVLCAAPFPYAYPHPPPTPHYRDVAHPDARSRPERLGLPVHSANRAGVWVVVSFLRRCDPILAEPWTDSPPPHHLTFAVHCCCCVP